MQEPLVSIVLPMYRVASVLPSCLASLKRQTYHHLELLFVDDCSPDDSACIVEREREALEALGMRVVLLRHTHNSGVAVARNTALDAATGAWVFHYDADDRLVDNAIEVMLQEALAKDVDIIGCQWALCHGANERVMHQPSVQTGREAFEMMCRGTLKWNLWLFLVRRELLEQDAPLRFIPKQNMGEDMMLMGRTFLRAQHISILPSVLYYYTKNDDGQLTGSYTDAHWAQVEHNVRVLEASISEDEREYINYLKLNLKLPLLISDKQADYNRWASWLTESHPYIMNNKALPIRTRLLQKLADLGQWWAVRLYYELIMKRLYAFLYK